LADVDKIGSCAICKRVVALATATMCIACATVEADHQPHTELRDPEYSSTPVLIYTTTNDPILTVGSFGRRIVERVDPGRTEEPHVPERERVDPFSGADYSVTGTGTPTAVADWAEEPGELAAPFQNRAARRAAERQQRRHAKSAKRRPRTRRRNR
jgi:hypothetical protein